MPSRNSPLPLPRELRPRSVVEPIHGLIRLTDEEFAVVDNALFRRLKQIRQNGLLFLVFPSATHHRFEHSLGVLHVADSMLEHLWLNSIVSRGKKAVATFDDPRVNVAIDLSGAPESEIRWVLRLTRFAALIHDLGHGPLSHTFDSFAPKRDDLRALLAAGVVPTLVEVADRLAFWGRKGMPGSRDYDRVPHEVMSCVLFAHIWQEVARAFAGDGETDTEYDPSLPLVVAAAVLGDWTLTASVLDPTLQSWLPFVHDIVASAPADADRMDYLERDSRSIGVTYGLFDRNRVMKSLLCYRQDHVDGARYRLGIKRSGMAALENFVQARYELFVQVYYHKTNQATSRMLGEIADIAQEHQVALFSPPSSDPQQTFKSWLDTYLDLSDDVFVRALRGLEPSILPVPPMEMRQIAEAVHARQLWKRLYEGEPVVAEWVHERLQAAEVDTAVRDGLVFDMSRPKATKDLETGARLLARGGDDGVYMPGHESNWLESSIIIEALQRAEGNIGRVYARGAALNHDSLERLKKQARLLGQECEAEYARERVLFRELRQAADEQAAELVARRRAQAHAQALLDLPQDTGTPRGPTLPIDT